MKNRIETQALSYAYSETEREVQADLPSKTVLDGLNLTIKSGSFVAVVGANGSGKSTLAKLCNGMLLPSGGRVFVDGMDTKDRAMLREIRRRVGLVFQNPDNQIVSSIVEDDVAFAPENLGIAPEEIRRRVDGALQAVGMADYGLHAPHLLSGGQKQRVAIAGIIAMRPKCIVLDEPTAMLDPVGRQEVLETIKALQREDNITIVLITHHMAECIHADRVVVLSRGACVLDDAPGAIFAKVQQLKALGLAVPETTELLYALKKKGLNLPLEALTVQACAKAIYEALS